MTASSVPAPIRSALRFLLSPLRTPVTWLAQHGLLSDGVKRLVPWRWSASPFTIYGDGWTCRYHSSPVDAIGQEIFYSGFRNWERETVSIFLKLIKESQCFIDVGANCGIYTLLACAVNPNVRVVAIEPVPRIHAALLNNVQSNHLQNRVQVIRSAASNAEGMVPFHESEDATMGSLAVAGYQGVSGKVIEVKTIRLDSLALRPDLIKIDVEGFEDLVLEGGSALIASCRPKIILEANPDGPYKRVGEILGGAGYHFFHLEPAGPIAASIIEPDSKSEFRNWLCLPN
jgi:FkbM family methyltransferase